MTQINASAPHPDAVATVSVVIPHLDDLDGLRRVVAALEAQTLDRARFEIIVVDNGSLTGIESVRSSAPTARVILVSEPGAGPARNGGVAAACGDVIAFTDSDCMPAPEWLATGLAALEKADLVGGEMVVGVVDRHHMTPTEAFESVFAFDNRAYIERKSFSVTANLFVRGTTFHTVGPFRAAVSEDVEWCRRAVGQGRVLTYCPGARVLHPARRTWRELMRKWHRTDREAYALWRDHGGTRVGWALRATAVLLSPLIHWVKVVRSPRLLGWRPRRDAIGVLVALRAARALAMIGSLSAPRTQGATAPATSH